VVHSWLLKEREMRICPVRRQRVVKDAKFHPHTPRGVSGFIFFVTMAAYPKITTLLAQGTLPNLQLYILVWLSYFEFGLISNVWMQNRYLGYSKQAKKITYIQ
jgi:hypothetical protein